MLACKYCLSTFDESEVDVRRNVYGRTSLGNELSEFVGLCPYCQSDDVVEATICEICNHPFADTENLGICECCLEEEETVDLAIKMGAESTIDVELNGFIATVLTNEKINSILSDYVKNNFSENAPCVTRYLERDKKALVEFIKEERGL